ncbi:MAG: hypothetical protein M1371_07395 [Actinobacteria bacterium]|nr:hypothetical protein [Actinomycetota bacterium]MCL5986376.1 hypothetical protein [Actinomycetota bacterium]
MKRKIGTSIDEDIYISAKVFAVRENKKFNEFIEEAITEYIKRKMKFSPENAQAVLSSKGFFKVDDKSFKEVMESAREDIFESR